MVAEITGVMNEVPVPTEDPPDAEVYQCIVPAEDVAPRVTVPGPHVVPGVVEVTDGGILTVIETLRAALVPHPFVAVTLKIPDTELIPYATDTELLAPVMVAPVPL